MSRSLVTGGFGFIASELTRQLLERGDTVAVLDPLTYAANPHSLADCEGRFEHVVCGVEDESAQDVVTHFKPDTIYHAAAESHVDRSIASYRGFVDTNIIGTFNLLEGCRRLDSKPLFVYISTDEVYGSLPEGRASEGAKLNPCNPYSVSKAAAEHTVRAAQHT
jgi:dTDP-glucose 4,6-dehydratase